jgi:hypothetical protein
MRRHNVLALLSIVGGLLVAFAGPWVGPGSIALGSGIETAGYSDFSFQYTQLGSTQPTGEKPQSKLWYNDGRWWADMFNNTSHTYHIYWLDIPTQSWMDTGTELDTRPQTQADCLWDNVAKKLYIVSGGGAASTGSNLDGWMMRYSYNPATRSYTRDFNPVIIRNGGAETIALDKDSSGKLWVTYTQNNQVYVNRSTTSDASWGTPFVIPGARSLDPDDISSLVAYRDQSGSRIGVLWSNHVSPSSMYFAYHRDGDSDTSWQPIETIYTAKCAADDHINLKSLQADSSGAIYAAVKTSFGDNGCGGSSSSPLIRLVVRKPNNSWSWATFGTVGDDHTRPIVLLDTTNRKVYMFATSPTACGTIYMKSTSMDSLNLTPSGKGTPFIKSTTYNCINNATSTKQTLDASTGLVVLASDENKQWYLHNYLDLGSQTFPRLVFSTSPQDARANVPFATQPVVVAQSSAGVTNTNFNGPITLAIKAGTGAGGAALIGTATVNAVHGVASFSGLAINKASTGYRLTASASGLSSADSGAFDIAKSDQTITFNPLPSKQYGNPPFTVSASASSGLPVSFSVSGKCSITGASITITGVGTCTVQASQAGNATFNPAPDVLQSFSILKANQTITFPPLPYKRYGDPPFTVSASASSGLPISFSVSGACTISDTTVTITGPSGCDIRASQAGNASFNPAPDVVQSLKPKLYLPMMQT